MNGGKHCYPGTDVLINKYGIKDKELLERLEIQKVATKLLGLGINPDRIAATFDTKHLISIHKYLFGDIYEWAGEFREENLYKSERVLSGGSAEYSDYLKIKDELIDLFKKQEDLVSVEMSGLEKCISDFLLDLWSIHPFREGNTRTCITFLWHYLQCKGINFQVELLRNNPMYVRDSLVMANYGQNEYLEKIISDALCNPYSEQKENASMNSEKAEQYQISKTDYELFRKKYSIKKTD